MSLALSSCGYYFAFFGAISDAESTPSRRSRWTLSRAQSRKLASVQKLRKACEQAKVDCVSNPWSYSPPLGRRIKRECGACFQRWLAEGGWPTDPTTCVPNGDVMDEHATRMKFAACLREWSANQSESVLRDMRDLLDATADTYWRQELLSSLGSIYFDLQQWDVSRNTLMGLLGIATSNLSIQYLMLVIAETYCHEGNMSVGYEWFEKAFDVAIADDTVGVTSVCLALFRWASIDTPPVGLTGKQDLPCDRSGRACDLVNHFLKMTWCLLQIC